MTFVYGYIKCRLGNQMFQYWVTKWIAEQLNRPMVVAFHEPVQLNNELYPNIGDVKVIQRLNLPPNSIPDQGIYIGKTVYEQNTVDIDAIIEKHRNSSLPIILDYHYEDYSNIKPREEWIKNLYKRSEKFPLISNNSLVVHLRLGDIANENIRIYDKYLEFTIKIAIEEQLPIIIVSEEINHYCTTTMKEKLESYGLSVDIANNTLEEYQKDFDIISSAKVIVASNSTFSWWATFLNPFNPKVYIALSDKQPANFRNDFLFKRKSPESWNLWDMDTNSWLI